MTRLALIAAAAALAAPLGGCGGESPEDRLEAYVERANAIQADAAPGLQRANQAYSRFASGDLEPDDAPTELAGAETAIRATRAELAELEPPADARTLHSHLLRFLDLNLGLAGETTQLAQYLPRASKAVGGLPKASRLLTRRLRSASGPPGQVRALARYRRSVDRAVRGLRRLDPPPLVASSHEDQVDRLRAIGSLSKRLGSAIRDRDARGVARLLLKFRRQQERHGRAALIDERSIRAYERRRLAADRQAAAVRREESRLQAELRR